MKDKWMNMGYEEEELKPFIEPVMDLSDEKRIDMLVSFLTEKYFNWPESKKFQIN